MSQPTFTQKKHERTKRLLADLEPGACINHGCTFYDNGVIKNCLVYTCNENKDFTIEECHRSEIVCE